MSKNITIGMIGLDTSHVPVFSKMLHCPDEPHHIPGARVTAAYPGGSEDWPASIDRVPDYTRELASEYATVIHDRPEAVAEAVDLVFIMTIDGRRHLELLERVLPAGKPVFIDKPFATTSTDAAAMIEMARQAGVPLMSCSSLRYGEALREARQSLEPETITGVDVFAPLSWQDALPGLFWYGCHGIEMVVTAMGTGCQSIAMNRGDDQELYVLDYEGGRRALFRGFTHGEFWHYGAVLNTAKERAFADVSAHPKPYYASMLESILGHLPQGRSPVPAEQMHEVVRILEACNAAREKGVTVRLDDVARPLKGALV